MSDKKTRYPECFGILESVFPLGENGLRITPDSCFPCVFKTECLRSAMAGTDGLDVREEIVDRAYASGMMKFLERWSKKKTLHQKKRRLK